jgi:catechol 2,3-dioxygenase-like lactoylglutathione lyase family enzyme
MTEARAKFSQLNIVSRDLEASIAFYRRLGVEIPEASIWRTRSGVHHVGASSGPTEEEINLDLDSTDFAGIWNAGWRGRTDLAGRVVVGFGVTSRAAVDALYADLTSAGYLGLQMPYDALWGARYAVVEDPDGVAIGLMSPISADKRSPPPDI